MRCSLLFALALPLLAAPGFAQETAQDLAPPRARPADPPSSAPSSPEATPAEVSEGESDATPPTTDPGGPFGPPSQPSPPSAQAPEPGGGQAPRVLPAPPPGYGDPPAGYGQPGAAGGYARPAQPGYAPGYGQPAAYPYAAPRRRVRVPYQEGMEVPPGGRVFSRRRGFLLYGGLGMFAGGYILGGLTALAFNDSALGFVPLLGPLLWQVRDGSSSSTEFSVISTLLQAAGFLGFVFGLKKRRYLEYWAGGVVEGRSLAVSPLVLPGGGGVSLTIF